MKILLFGKHGQVGWELQRSLAPLGAVLALDRTGAPGLCGDLLDPQGLAATVRAVRPDVIVNAAAYTAVDRAEQAPDAAARVNGTAVAALAHAAAASGALLLHYSTDYVFDGSGSLPWRETDTPAPLNAYGRTKLEGERAIAAAGCRHVVLRTSWVYAARGSNFLRTMRRLAMTHERVTVVDDEWGAPTGAELLADVSAHVLRRACADPAALGTYHVAAAGATTWRRYAEHVFARLRQARGAQVRVHEVVPVTTEVYGAAAPRPLNSRLDTARLRTTFGLALPAWECGVDRALAELDLAVSEGAQ